MIWHWQHQHYWNINKHPDYHSFQHKKQISCDLWQLQNFSLSAHFSYVLHCSTNHSVVKSASAGFQFFPPTEVIALVRNRNLEEWHVRDEIGQPDGQAWASAHSVKDSCGRFLGLPLDVLQYYQSLFQHSLCVEKETGAHPAVTSSSPDQPLQTAPTAFQVGQGHKGDCCY